MLLTNKVKYGKIKEKQGSKTMKLKYILFDLDGTLLPMNQDIFIQNYFKSVIDYMTPYGYDPKQLQEAIGCSIMSVVMNDGKKTNETVFWDTMKQSYDDNIRDSEPIYVEYYKTSFKENKKCCGYNELANFTIKALKDKGYKLILATNPVFPRIATEQRIEWAGVDKNDFELITTYENSHHCKPYLNYYNEVLEKIGATPEECLMVGNDAVEDMIARELGMNVFLLTDCLINSKNKDISNFPQGGFLDLLVHIKNIK